MPDKRPRQYAAEIAQLKTRELRNRALEAVPAHLQALVKTHVINRFNHAKNQQT